MIKAKNFQVLTIVSALSILAGSAYADVPKVISYQGRLTDSSGTPVADGDYGVTFQIVEHDPMPMGESPLWSSGVQTVTVTDGLFEYYLGSNVPLPAEIFNDDGLDSYFLRMHIEGSMLFSSGIPLAAAPFAVRSVYSDTAAYSLAGPGSGSGGWVDDGSVVRLENAGDLVGIGTATPNERLVVGKDMGNLYGDFVVASNPAVDGMSGFTAGYDIDNRGWFSWDNEEKEFQIGVRNNGTNSPNNIYLANGNVGIGSIPPDSTGLFVKCYYGFDLDHYLNWGFGISSEVIKETHSGRASAGHFSVTSLDGGIVHGVYAEAQGEDYACEAGRFASTGVGIVAIGDIRSADFWGDAEFHDDVDISGNLSKSSGSFRIDHPLDPENKYLQHSFVESPDMMNVYSGNVILDENGKAKVTMPNWFEPLNRDFRYQLTCIGGFEPVYISEEMNDGEFSIAGGSPGLKVSWMVTGIRQDRWANEHRIQVEVDKPAEEQGYYIAPELYGHGKEKGIDYKRHGNIREARD